MGAAEVDGRLKRKTRSGDTERALKSKADSPSAKKYKSYSDAKAYVLTLAGLTHDLVCMRAVLRCFEYDAKTILPRFCALTACIG